MRDGAQKRLCIEGALAGVHGRPSFGGWPPQKCALATLFFLIVYKREKNANGSGQGDGPSAAATAGLTAAWGGAAEWLKIGFMHGKRK